MLNSLKSYIKITPDKTSRSIAIILMLMTLAGFSLEKEYSFKPLFGSPVAIILALAAGVVLFIVYAKLINIVYLWIDNYTENAYKKNFQSMKKTNGIQNSLVTGSFINEHYLLFCFIVIMASWLPYYIIYMPGSVPADGSYQLLEGTGVFELTNGHSWLLSLWFGAIYKTIGKLSANLAIFFIVFTNGLLEALAYAYVLNVLKKLNCPKWLNIASLVFYAANPCIATYAQAVLKDGLFYAAMAVFTVSILDILINKNVKKKDYFILLLAALMLLILRRDGVARVIIGLVLLLLFISKNRKWHVVSLMAVVMAMQLLLGAAADMLDVVPGLKREPYSIPLQQTARFIKEFPDDLTPAERRAIARVLDINTIAEAYNPEISDYVKVTFNENATPYELNAYKKTWLSMLRKHPVLCLETTLSNSFGYFYPSYTFTQMRAYQLYNSEDGNIENGLTYRYVLPKSIREGVNSFLHGMRKVPVLRLLFSPGFYTWLIIIGLGYMLRTKKRTDIVFWFALINIMICIGSPVNGLIRYADIYIVLVPIAACTLLSSSEQSDSAIGG